jgi:hypothetical protein
MERDKNMGTIYDGTNGIGTWENGEFIRLRGTANTYGTNDYSIQLYSYTVIQLYSITVYIQYLLSFLTQKKKKK